MVALVALFWISTKSAWEYTIVSHMDVNEFLQKYHIVSVITDK